MNNQMIQSLLDEAKRQGADAADVLFSNGEKTEVRVLNGAPEAFETAQSRAIGLRVFVDGRQAVGKTTQFTRDALSTLAENVCAMAKATPVSKHSRMATQDELQKNTSENISRIDIFDKSDNFDAEKLHNNVAEIEAIGLKQPKVSKSSGSFGSFNAAEVQLVGSNGFAEAYKSSFYSQGLSLIAGHGDEMVTSWAYESRRHARDLPSLELTAKEAGIKVARKLGGKPIPSGNMPVVFDRHMAATLLGHLSDAVNGNSIVRGTSFLYGKMGEQIFADDIHVFDDPLLARGLASKPFDAEGLAVGRHAIIENGALQSWLLDITSANQLGLHSTGNATRSAGSLPMPSSSNLFMQPGNQSPEELIKDIGHGLFVTSLMGNAVNPMTGDYSRGAEGLLIENGKLTKAVANVTIAGNLLDIYQKIEPANDLIYDRSICSPTVRIDGMAVAGT